MQRKKIQTRHRKKLTKKQRRRRQRALFLRLLFFLLLCLGLFFIFFGKNKITSGSSGASSQNSLGAEQEDNPDLGISIVLNRDGKIVQTDRELFDKAAYDSSALEAMVNSEIKAYAEKTGRDSAVKLRSLSVKKGIAELRLEFEKAEDYASFNGTEFKWGKVQDVLKTRDDLSVTVSSVDDGVMLDFDETMALKGQVVIMNEDLDFECPGRIKYVSRNVEAVERDRAVVNGSENTAIIIYD